MTTKEQLRELVDQVPESELATAELLLAALWDIAQDPVYRALQDAREDDEPTTEEDIMAIEKGWEQYRQGKGRYLER